MRELRKILYVEDEPDIRAIARLALETVGGMDVCICGSGQEALEVAEEYAPDLILLDVMMPGMDGPTTMAALKALPTLADKPMVFMTAKVQPHEVRHYRDIGAVEVIPKPFDPMLLADQVKDVWASTQG